MNIRKIYFLALIVSLITAWFFIPQPAFAAISRVETVCSNSTNAVTFSTATTQGELIVVSVGVAQGSSAPDGGVTDNKSGGSSTYTSIQSISGFGAAGKSAANLYYTANAASGITQITLSPGAGNEATYSGLCASHYTGIATSNPLDVSQDFTAAQDTPWSSTATGVLSQANELVVGAVINFPNGAGDVDFTATGALTERGEYNSNGGVYGAYADAVVSSTASVTYSGTSSLAGANNTVAIATFKSAVSGPPDTTAPTVPSGLTASTISSSQINLSWSVSTDNTGVTGYTIYRNGSQIGTAANTSYNNTGLTASTAYSYTVDAYDAAGNHSSQSTSASATTQLPPPPDIQTPSIPANLSATAVSSSQINLSWTASTDNVGVTGYRIYRGGTQIGTSATNSYSNTGLTASTAYSYTISAYDAAGNVSAQSASISATTPAVTPPPTGLRTFYIASNGSDSNNGTSKDTPWAHLPGMPTCAGVCAATTPRAGDNFILKGGDTWGATSLGINWQWSGSNSSRIYIGVDKTWFSGASWVRPIFDLQNTMGASRQYNNVIWISGNYVTFDNIEMTRFQQSGSGGTLVGAYGNNNEVENFYIHGWSRTSGSSGFNSFALNNNWSGGGGIGTNFHNNVIDGEDSPNKDFMAGVLHGDIVRNNIIRYVYNGMNGAFNVIDGNIVEYNYISTSGDHCNLIFPQNVFTGSTLIVSNNIIRNEGCGGGSTLFTMGNSGCANCTSYVYNNVIYSNGSSFDPGITIGSHPANGSAGTFYVYNNTVNAEGAFCMGNGEPSPRSTTYLANNHCINGTLCDGRGTTCNDLGGNLLMTAAQATAAGYTSSQTYAFSPTSANSPTVGLGINFTSISSGNVTALDSDTTYPSYDSVNHKVVMRTAVARPATGPWDIGAYQYSSEGTPPLVDTTPPLAPTGVIVN